MWTWLNILFHVAMLVLFIFQMNKAFIRFYEEPKVSQVSQENYGEVKEPLIFICSADQFDFKRATELGYGGHFHYLTGT